MTAVLVHGVADTCRSFDRLRAHLSRRDVRTVALPGFGCETPSGFAATKEAYVDWLIADLSRIGAPVDLVGHDWGCILTARVASLRPDLVRSWTGMSAAVSRDYVWHPLARAWQAPLVGEAAMAVLGLGLEAQLRRHGMPALEATQSVRRLDRRMKTVILKLYRSAVHVGREWEADLSRIAAPALVLWGQRDAFVPHRFADRLAQASGARTVLKLDAGHWPHLERPAEVARALETHWALPRQSTAETVPIRTCGPRHTA